MELSAQWPTAATPSQAASRLFMRTSTCGPGTPTPALAQCVRTRPRRIWHADLAPGTAAACGFAPALALRTRTRRRAEGQDKPGLDGVKKWIEEKKAQGTAGVSGAVVGGMLGGPIGAVVGAQVASKMGPALDSALKAMEGDLDEEEKAEADAKALAKAEASTAKPKEEKAKAKASTAKPKEEKAKAKASAAKPKEEKAKAKASAAKPKEEKAKAKASAAKPKEEKAKAKASAAKPKEEKAKAKAPPKELEATAAAQIPSKEDEAPPADVNEAPPKAAPAPDAAAGAPAAPAAARGDDLLDELQALRRGVPEKEKKLEAELAELYAKAEEALKAGDEEAARKLLESKAKTQASLDSLREGQKRREAQQSEQLVSLEAQVKDLYERAEKSLAAGNETDARRYLQEREQALKKLADLKQTRET